MCTPRPLTRHPTPQHTVLGLTVGAFLRGMGALATADRAKSQSMMRFRVLFQLCTVGALVGGISLKAVDAPFAAAVVAPPAPAEGAVLEEGGARGEGATELR